MTDKERLDFLIKTRSMIWNEEEEGVTVCVPSRRWAGHNEIEANHRNMRKAIDEAYRIFMEDE